MTVSTTRHASGADDERCPGRDASVAANAPSALPRLVADPESFAQDVWGRRALLTTAADLPAGPDLFSEDAVDELISERGLRTPFLRVAKDGSTLPTGAFTRSGGVGAGITDQLDDTRLTSLFAAGATLVLQALHRTWGPIADFTGTLAEELGHPVQVNAYVTPPSSRGFDDHYDVHDVFVLQISGEKHWRIHAPVHRAPLRDQPWTDRREAVADEAAREPVIDVVLRPGDCLYLPRGYLHAATALGDVSTHLTFGVHPWTRHGLAADLVDQAVDLLADDELVRGSLPLGVSVADAVDLAADTELVRERLHAAIDAVPVRALAERLARRADTAGRPAPVGPLAQLRAAQATTANAESSEGERFVLRPRLRARWHGGRLVTRAGAVEVNDAERDVVQRLLDGALEPLPVELAQRLLAAGIVTPA